MLVEEAGASLNEVCQDYAKRINRSAQFMDALLADLLAFSCVSQQRIALATVNLKTVMEEVLSRLELEIQNKTARVKMVGLDRTVLAHEPTLGQVLFNLVGNALKFVEPGASPVVQVKMETLRKSPTKEARGRGKEHWVRVWVDDEGIGIAPDHQKQIFRPFIRLHGKKYPGTGIGLGIVAKGVERMGGRVGVESGVGRGSRFWFELLQK